MLKNIKSSTDLSDPTVFMARVEDWAHVWTRDHQHPPCWPRAWRWTVPRTYHGTRERRGKVTRNKIWLLSTLTQPSGSDCNHCCFVWSPTIVFYYPQLYSLDSSKVLCFRKSKVNDFYLTNIIRGWMLLRLPFSHSLHCQSYYLILLSILTRCGMGQWRYQSRGASDSDTDGV